MFIIYKYKNKINSYFILNNLLFITFIIKNMFNPEKIGFPIKEIKLNKSLQHSIDTQKERNAHNPVDMETGLNDLPRPAEQEPIESSSLLKNFILTVIIIIHSVIATIIIIGNIYFLEDNENYGCVVYEYRYTSLTQLFVVEIIMCIFILIGLFFSQVSIFTNKICLSENTMTRIFILSLGSYVGVGFMNISMTYLFGYKLEPSDLCTNELIRFMITMITLKWIIFGIVLGLLIYINVYERHNLY
jgi:heme/copper-type cytochrome/quinol oxidase subunit 2